MIKNCFVYGVKRPWAQSKLSTVESFKKKWTKYMKQYIWPIDIDINFIFTDQCLQGQIRPCAKKEIKIKSIWIN